MTTLRICHFISDEGVKFWHQECRKVFRTWEETMEIMENTWERPLVVVTGASSGIGYELAKQFAVNGFDLIIAAQSDSILEAQEALSEFEVNVYSVQANLASGKGVEKLIKRIQKLGRPVEAIAVNAGVGVGGPFLETDLKEEINMINLNVISSVHLLKRVLGFMVERGQGRVLITSSIAAVMPAPFEAVYGATKAFLLSFAEAIRNEVRDSGITVTTLMPGATNTNFFHRAGMDDTRVGSKTKFENDPVDVAREGFEALMAGREKVVSASVMTKLQGWASKILPESTKAQFHRKLSEPGSAQHH